MYQPPGPYALILKVKDPTVKFISQWCKNVGINKGRIRAKINYLSLMYMHSLFTYILYIVKSIPYTHLQLIEFTCPNHVHGHRCTEVASFLQNHSSAIMTNQLLHLAIL